MSRVQAFLPQFAASTAEITRRAEEDPASVDIEKLGDEDRYIQMVRSSSNKFSTKNHVSHDHAGSRTWGF